ncbi:MAG: MotA/TolQ/ExbB proton channel family protein [Gemmatimonadetes bacterium]|nr:MotA/TolQ/ExbB proton channel family protein [Gemmatimonadota bacterium]
MKNVVFWPVLALCVAVSWFLWTRSPEYIRQGGPLLIFGMTCFLLVITYAIERTIVLTRAGGRGALGGFVDRLLGAVRSGDVGGAIDAAKTQGGSLANVVGAGLQKYRSLTGTEPDRRNVLADTRRSMEETMSLESPTLERNLSALSTLASIATLIGLLGTTIGMIRAFRAMSHAGAPDATQLALGISEALVNTAVGLTTAILATVLYNHFTTRVDQFGARIEETAYQVLDALEENGSK